MTRNWKTENQKRSAEMYLIAEKSFFVCSSERKTPPFHAFKNGIEKGGRGGAQNCPSIVSFYVRAFYFSNVNYAFVRIRNTKRKKEEKFNEILDWGRINLWATFPFSCVFLNLMTLHIFFFSLITTINM